MHRSSLRPVLAAAALLATTAASAHGAPGTPRLSLVGSASVIGASVQLTPPIGTQSGAAWFAQAIDITRSFEVKFDFSLANGTFPQADGMAFVIQNAGPDAIGDLGGGGGLGFDGLTSVAAVIQTYTNDRVGITTDGNPYDAKSAHAALGDCGTIQGTETVGYDASAHTLKMNVQLTCDGTSMQFADGRQVDISQVLGTGTATIGFSGGSGDNFADQRVGKISFKYLP